VNRLTFYSLSLILVTFSFSFAFVHPKDVKSNRRKIQSYKRVERKDLSALRKKMNHSIEQSGVTDGYSALSFIAGSSVVSGYPTSEGYYGFSWILANRDSMGMRASIGYSSNSAGSTLRSIPINLDVLVNYNAVRSLNFYAAGGVGYTMLQGAVEKSGFNLHLSGGLNLNMSRQSALFFEYEKTFLILNDTDYGSDLIKFGFTFKLLPSRGGTS
jgi:hypothetical protein